MLMFPQNFVSYIVDACGSNNMLRITVKAMDFKNNLKKMKVHCEAVIIGPACLKFHVKKRLWAKTWAQAANKENNQARSEREVFTAGRENRISFTHSCSRINPGSKAFTAIPRCWLQGTLYSDWFWKKFKNSDVGQLLFFQISLEHLRWPVPFLLTPSPQTLPQETPLRAETPPSVPLTHGSPSWSTVLGRSLVSRWGQSGCMLVTVTSTQSITWSG